MFDTTCCNPQDKTKFVELMRSRLSEKDLSPSNVAVISWEEHCVECGQPYCFKTCQMYERAYDGKCKRFKNGIAPIGGGHLCEFKKWAKLEGVFTGRMWAAPRQRLFALLDRPFSWLARTINRLMWFVPGRIGAITIYRRLKKWAFDYLPGKRDFQVDCLALNVWADQPVSIHFSIIDKDRNLFDDVVALRQGWNEWRSSFPPVGKGTRFLLFSTEEKEFALLFARLDLFRMANGSTLMNAGSRSTTSAKFVKCVAWDLDNTLWKGILVEDGADGLVLNEAAVSLIKTLDQRGIVHTVLSKNDFEPALAVLKRFGLEEYFVFPHINWLPKSGNLQATAKEINIGLDAFAFIDDSPFERGEVSEQLPMVRVFNSTEIEKLAELPEFNPPISAESAGRRHSYRKEMLRRAAASEFQGDYDEFLRSCGIVLTMFDLRGASEAECQRCYELIQRTNQLTLAGRRYSKDEFKSLVSRKGMQAFGIRCADKFGDYGIVGVVLYSVEAGGAKVEEFVMSCRVAKKRCEDATVNWIASVAHGQGAMNLSADVIETGRNMALVEAFDGIAGMKKQRDGNSVRYNLDLANGIATMQVVMVRLAGDAS